MNNTFDIETDGAIKDKEEIQRLNRWIRHLQNYCRTDKYAHQSAHINVPHMCAQALNGDDIPEFYRERENNDN